MKDSIIQRLKGMVSKKVYHLALFFTKFGYVLYLYWICCFVIRYFRLEMELLFLLTSLYGFYPYISQTYVIFNKTKLLLFPYVITEVKFWAPPVETFADLIHFFTRFIPFLWNCTKLLRRLTLTQFSNQIDRVFLKIYFWHCYINCTSPVLNF